MSDCPNIPQCVARFIHHHSYIRADGHTVRPTAFLEKRPGTDISVDGHQILREDIHWEAGREMNPSHTLLGAADLSSDTVVSLGLQIVPDGKNFPSHADIRVFSDDPNIRRKIAQQLATASCFVPVPSSHPSAPGPDAAPRSLV